MTQVAPATPVQGSLLVVGVGAPQGLGAAIARRFGKGGFPVVIAGRNAPKLEESRAALQAEGVTVTSVVGDGASRDDARKFVAAAEALAPLAVAVHNAGGNRPAPFLEVSAEHFEGHWREHALGAFHLAQAALPVLVARGGGSLIFTGASGSLRGKATSRRLQRPRRPCAPPARASPANLARGASTSAT